MKKGLLFLASVAVMSACSTKTSQVEEASNVELVTPEELARLKAIQDSTTTADSLAWARAEEQLVIEHRKNCTCK
jgi:hypothetical protein